MKLTIYRTDRPERSVYRSSQKRIILGRPKNIPIDFDLSPDLKVSRPHAQLLYKLSTWWVEDLGSKHGTYLNNEKIIQTTPLSPGDTLQLGDTLLRVEFLLRETPSPSNFEVVSRRHVDEIEPPRKLSEGTRTEFLATFAQISASYSGVRSMLARFLEEIGEIFPLSERRSIVMIDDDRELVPEISWPPGPANVSFTLARRAVTSQETILWTRSVGAGDGTRISSLFDTTAAICAPMMFNGRIVGVIYLDSTGPDGGFSEADRDSLSEIASLIAAPIMASANNSLPRYPSVYVSYPPARRKLARRLAGDLRRRRVKVWLDDRLKVGDDRKQVIETAIKATDAFVPLIGPNGEQETQARWELDTAVEAGKRILPLLYEAGELPRSISHLVPLHLDSDHYDISLAALVETIYQVAADMFEQAVAGSPEQPQPSLGQRDSNCILLLAANPLNTVQLRLEREARAIDHGLLRTPFRNRFELERHGAVRYKDLCELLMRYQPRIVHFSGHGSKSGKVILEDDAEMGQTITDDALVQLFRLFKDDIRCIVLNACLTASQAEAIAEVIDVVVGMSDEIEDEIAIDFAETFYNALGYGRNVEFAFEVGRARLANSGAEIAPRLFVKDGVDAANIIFD